MSKSTKAEKSRILITDSPDQIRSKVGSALTDSFSGITYEPTSRPGIANLLDILSIFDPQQRTAADLAKDYETISPKQLKSMVSEAVIEGLQGIGERYRELLSGENGHLDRVAKHGAQKARQSAEDTMDLVRTAIGF
jgi:tryptophanyl-tRNA synthetase